MGGRALGEGFREVIGACIWRLPSAAALRLRCLSLYMVCSCCMSCEAWNGQTRIGCGILRNMGRDIWGKWGVTHGKPGVRD